MRRFIASGFGVGFLPRRLWKSDAGAGTFGAALAALIAFFMIDAGGIAQALVAGFTIVVSLWASAPFADEGADPGWVCIDEMAGTFVAVIGLAGWPWVVAVAVARLADIFKVLPGVGAAEDLHGSIGITMDDVVAGIYGLAAGWLIFALIG